ncbi:MAG: hypothetical protein OHK0035_32680 [Cyanobacteria bacterium J069]
MGPALEAAEGIEVEGEALIKISSKITKGSTPNFKKIGLTQLDDFSRAQPAKNHPESIELVSTA